MKKAFLKYKKGNIGLDVLVIAVVVFIIAIAIFAGKLIHTELDPLVVDMINESNQSNAAQSIEFIDKGTRTYSEFWDYALATIFIFSWGAVIIGTFLLDSNPTMIIIGLIFLIPSLLVGVYTANTYDDLESELNMEGEFPITFWLMNHWLMTLIIIGVSEGVAIYAKVKTM